MSHESNGAVVFESLEDAARAYAELKGDFVRVSERLDQVSEQLGALVSQNKELAQQGRDLLELCRLNGTALELLLQERGLELPDKPEAPDGQDSVLTVKDRQAAGG